MMCTRVKGVFDAVHLYTFNRVRLGGMDHVILPTRANPTPPEAAAKGCQKYRKNVEIEGDE